MDLHAHMIRCTITFNICLTGHFSRVTVGYRYWELLEQTCQPYCLPNQQHQSLADHKLTYSVQYGKTQTETAYQCTWPFYMSLLIPLQQQEPLLLSVLLLYFLLLLFYYYYISSSKDSADWSQSSATDKLDWLIDWLIQFVDCNVTFGQLMVFFYK